MHVEFKGVRQALTTNTRIPIAGRFEYVYELADEFSAKYCEGSFMAGIRMQGAELYYMIRASKGYLGKIQAKIHHIIEAKVPLLNLNSGFLKPHFSEKRLLTP